MTLSASKKDLNSKELSKMTSTFFESSKKTEILNILSFEHSFLINWNLDKFPNISDNFEGKKFVDHILEISKLVVFVLNVLTVILQNHVNKIVRHGTKTI